MRGCSGRNLAGPMSRLQPVETSLRGGPNRGSSTRQPLRVMAASSNPSPLHARLVIQNVLQCREVNMHIRSIKYMCIYVRTLHVRMYSPGSRRSPNAHETHVKRGRPGTEAINILVQ